MKAIKISEFKSHLSEYLRKVKNGVQIELLDRGKPVARVSALEDATEIRIQKPLKDPAKIASIKSKVRDFDGEVMDVLLQERSTR